MKNCDLKEFADMHIHLSDIDFDVAQKYFDDLASLGLTDVVLQSLTYRAICYNLSILYWKKHYKKMNVAAYGMIHNMPNDPYIDIPFEVQAKTLLDMGCDGIKLMFSPDIRSQMGMGINDERYEKMFAYLEKEGVPLCIHVNDPDEFWVPRELEDYEIERHWGYFQEDYLSKRELYDETFEMLDRHPNIKITFAHFFFLSKDIDEAARVLDKYPNVTFDLTPNMFMYTDFTKDIESWKNFFIKYQDRIIFGTDCNDTKSRDINSQLCDVVYAAISQSADEFKITAYDTLYTLRGLGLPSDAIEKICYGNYKRIVPSIKPINDELYITAAKRLYSDIKDSGADEFKASEAWTKELLDKMGI